MRINISMQRLDNGIFLEISVSDRDDRINGIKFRTYVKDLEEAEVSITKKIRKILTEKQKLIDEENEYFKKSIEKNKFENIQRTM